MTNIKFWDVYDGGRQGHLDLPALTAELEKYRRTYRVVSDAAAQTIAAQWQSPAKPYGTRLSTMGKVDRYADLFEDFISEEEFRQLDPDGWEVIALRALSHYLKDRQLNKAKTGYRPCACDDCMDIAIGRAGELCTECAEAGCSATEHADCEREVTDGLDLPSYGD